MAVAISGATTFAPPAPPGPTASIGAKRKSVACCRCTAKFNRATRRLDFRPGWRPARRWPNSQKSPRKCPFPHPILRRLSETQRATKSSATSLPNCWREIWQGEVRRVIAALAGHQERLGTPPPDTEANDPRCRVARAVTYYTNNQSRMNYPDYRRQGLPITSSHIESTIKQVNARIKGTEKFWERTSGDAVLQLRADTLSDSRPLQAFWNRWQARQNGVNCYRTAA